VGAIFDKFAVRNLPPTIAFFCRFYILFLLVFPFLVRDWPAHKAAMLAAPRMASVHLLMSVVAYLGGMFAYYHALGVAEASKVVPFSSAYPLITFLLSLAFLGEPFTWAKFSGTLLVIAGLSLLVR